MKLPMKWAQSFAPFACTPQEFADKMTMSGSKVETFESEADHMKNVVIGRVAKLERHPDSDHLWITQIDVGADALLQIVTGAQNLTEGDLCPVALHGAQLPNGQTIKRGKLRGAASEGMLCSLPELNLTTHDFPDATEDGILVLADEGELTKPGADAAAALGMDDVTFEFEITPNRPDCLSVRGLAREAAATFGVPFSAPAPVAPEGQGDVTPLLSVRVEAVDTCARYAAAMVDNVRIAPSPKWLRQRLRQAGVRPINNIVDITNYVMLEFGQPMHAFDYAYVNGQKITVRMAKPGEKIVTLDGVTRELDSGMMVIADEKGPIAVAGVMGGEHSGVYDTTKMVVFESANFSGPSVRATSGRLGLRTESSGRFEKGLDPSSAGPALRRALELVRQLDAGDIIGGVLDDYPAPPPPRSVPLRVESINALLGIEVPRQDMEAILQPLGFSVESETVHVPSWRGDVARYCDLAEEIARFVGYNKIPNTVLIGAADALPTERQRFEERVCDLLAGYGLWECETFSFYSPKSFDMINLPPESPLRDAVKIMNPLGEDTSLMRTTALPSMMEVVGRNWASRNEDCALYELATVYHPTPDADKLPDEKQSLVLAAYGAAWDYLAMKGAVEGLMASFGVEAFEVERVADDASFHPGRCARVLVPDGSGKKAPCRPLCTLGEVHPRVCASYGIKPRVVAAVLDMDALFDARGPVPQYHPLAKFPAITRDLALVMEQGVPAADVEKIIRKAGGKRLESLRLFDIYTGEKLGEGKKSLAYSLVLRDAGATLTDGEADEITNKVLKDLKGLDVVLRTQ